MSRHADRARSPRDAAPAAPAARSSVPPSASPSADTTRAWVEVDVGALARNAGHIARVAGVPLLPMVKADAYGLGAAAVVRVLERLAPWGYGIATVREGEELRAAGVERPLLVFTPLLPADFPAARAARLTPVIGDPATIGAWLETGAGAWHLGVDTGMSRAGIPWREVARVAPLCERHPPEGVATHFHSAHKDDGTRDLQEQRFREAVAALPARPPLLHAENSPALERRHPSRYDLARPGVYLYGVGSGIAPQPAPVAHLRARVVEMRDIAPGDTVSYDGAFRADGPRRIATACVGYADGYRRALSDRGVALVRGRRVPVAGLVTMDMTMLDVTGVPCAVGDVVTLLGRDGDEVLTAEDVAARGALSPYELLTGLRARLPRRYVGTA